MATSISKRIFGADLVPEIKDKLKARQKLSKQSEPLSAIQTEDENYTSNFLDSDKKALIDLSSRTPFARMWTAVQVQRHTHVKTIDNVDGDQDIKVLQEQDDNANPKRERIYITEGDDIVVKKITREDTAIYMVGTNKLNNLPTNPNEPVQSKTSEHWGVNGFNDIFLKEQELNSNEFFKPSAAIVNIDSTTEGSFGMVKKTTVNFVVSNFHDFDEIYSKYFLRPGARVFVDFGWDTSLLYSPKQLLQNYQGSELEKKLYGEEGVVSKGFGEIDVLSGNVTDYSSDIQKDGSIQCSVTIISQNNALVDHSLEEEQESVKNRIVARLDYEIIKFAASHFTGGDQYFSADFINNP